MRHRYISVAHHRFSVAHRAGAPQNYILVAIFLWRIPPFPGCATECLFWCATDELFPSSVKSPPGSISPPTECRELLQIHPQTRVGDDGA